MSLLDSMIPPGRAPLGPGGLLDPSTMNMPGPQQTPQNAMNMGPGPQAAQPPQPPPPPPTLWQRILAGAKQLPSVLMDDNGMSSILGPEAVSHARSQGLLDMGLSMMANSRGVGGQNAPSFGQALAGGVQAARGGFSSELQQRIQNAVMANQLNARGQMAELFAPKPGETPDETRQRMTQAFMFASAHGLDIAKDMAPAMRGMMTAGPEDKNTVVPQGASVVGPGGNVLLQGTPKPTEPVIGSPEWKQAEEFKAKVAAQYRTDPSQVIQDKNGQFYILNKATNSLQLVGVQGKGGSTTNLPAPMALKVSQFGEMLKKSSDLLPAMDALNVSLGQSAASDIAQNGVGEGHLRIPGTKGIGAMMVNRTPEYAAYQAALVPFVIAAAHAQGGARITAEQVDQLRQSVEMKPGDSPKVRQQRIKNVIDLMNSTGGALPQDAIAAQEDQMDPNQLGAVRGYGYKGAARSSPSGPPPAGGKRSITADQAAFLRTKKNMSQADIDKNYTVVPQ